MKKAILISSRVGTIFSILVLLNALNVKPGYGWIVILAIIVLACCLALIKLVENPNKSWAVFEIYFLPWYFSFYIVLSNIFNIQNKQVEELRELYSNCPNLKVFRLRWKRTLIRKYRREQVPYA